MNNERLMAKFVEGKTTMGTFAVKHFEGDI